MRVPARPPGSRARRSARWLVLLALAGLLGATPALLPATAGSETSPTIDAVSSGAYHWEPSLVSVGTNATVDFANSSGSVPHAVEWTSAQKPACSGVPEAGAYSWQGSCTFAQEGTYTFRCSVHHYMTGTITVGAGGTVTTTVSGPPVTTTTATTTDRTSPGGSRGGGEEAGRSGAGVGGGGSAGGSREVASRRLRLAAHQRGAAVAGSLTVPTPDAGGRLTVALLAPPGRLRGSATAGRLVRRHLRSGHLAFTVSLNARARAALERERSLAVTLAIVLAPPRGRAQRARRHLTLRLHRHRGSRSGR